MTVLGTLIGGVGMGFRMNVLNLKAVLKDQDLSQQAVEMWLKAGKKSKDLRLVVNETEYQLIDITGITTVKKAT